MTVAAYLSHARRKFYELADIAAGKRRGEHVPPPISPRAMEAVTRIDALFDIERGINGETTERRLAVRCEQSAPLLAGLEDRMRTEHAGLPRHSPATRAMNHMLKRRDGFARLLQDRHGVRPRPCVLWRTAGAAGRRRT